MAITGNGGRPEDVAGDGNGVRAEEAKMSPNSS